MRTNERMFWISNISKRDVIIGDLRVCVPARKSVNLLDSRHYSLTEEEIIASLKDGSLAKRQDIIKIRKVPPPKYQGRQIEVSDLAIPRAVRSAVKVEQVEYEELDIPDEQFASDQADLPEYDKYTKQ